MKTQKGITLIALVITIIVLLILAGVSISLVVGENGVLNKASTAKEETIISQESETVKLAAAAAKVDTLGGEILEANLARELTNTIGERDVDYRLEDSGENFLVTYLDTNRGYLVSKDGTVTQRGKWYTEFDVNTYTNVVTDGINVYQIGDIVYYDHITGVSNKTYTSAKEKTGSEADQIFDITDSDCYPTDVESGLWRILGATDKGELLIVSDDVVRTNDDTNYYLKGQKGYENSISELDTISKLFGHGYGATYARSIRMEDINKITGYVPEDRTNMQYIDSYGVEVTAYWDGDKTPYYVASNDKIVDSSSDHSANGFYWYDNNTLKNSTCVEGTKVIDVADMKKIGTIKNSFYWYYVDDYLETDTKAFETLFDNTYHVATKWSTYENNRFEYGIFEIAAGCNWGGMIGFWSNELVTSKDSNGEDNHQSLPVRPVVILEEDIQLSGSSAQGWTIVK